MSQRDRELCSICSRYVNRTNLFLHQIACHEALIQNRQTEDQQRNPTSGNRDYSLSTTQFSVFRNGSNFPNDEVFRREQSFQTRNQVVLVPFSEPVTRSSRQVTPTRPYAFFYRGLRDSPETRVIPRPQQTHLARAFSESEPDSHRRVRCPKCSELIFPGGYADHNRICDFDYCEFCGEGFRKLLLKEHMKGCIQRESNRISESEPESEQSLSKASTREINLANSQRSPTEVIPVRAYVPRNREILRVKYGNGSVETRVIDKLPNGTVQTRIEFSGRFGNRRILTQTNSQENQSQSDDDNNVEDNDNLENQEKQKDRQQEKKFVKKNENIEEKEEKKEEEELIEEVIEDGKSKDSKSGDSESEESEKEESLSHDDKEEEEDEEDEEEVEIIRDLNNTAGTEPSRVKTEESPQASRTREEGNNLLGVFDQHRDYRTEGDRMHPLFSLRSGQRIFNPGRRDPPRARTYETTEVPQVGEEGYIRIRFFGNGNEASEIEREHPFEYLRRRQELFNPRVTNPPQAQTLQPTEVSRPREDRNNPFGFFRNNNESSEIHRDNSIEYLRRRRELFNPRVADPPRNTTQETAEAPQVREEESNRIRSIEENRSESPEIDREHPIHHIRRRRGFLIPQVRDPHSDEEGYIPGNPIFPLFFNHQRFMQINRNTVRMIGIDLLFQMFMNGETTNQGMSREQINEIPIISFEKNSQTAKGEEEKCSICITEYENGEKIRKLPCSHLFHPECVDTWLVQNSSCPVCKHDIGS